MRGKEETAELHRRWRASMRAIAVVVQREREERQWTRGELADAAGEHTDVPISEYHVRSVEVGNPFTFNPHLIRPILKALGVEEERYYRAAGLDD